MKRKKLLALLILCLFYMNNIWAQTLPPPTIASPNVASLGTFGTIPVSLFTGVPDISIPIHTLKYGNIEVPIALRYHPGSVKPAQHPGWVGLGWNLQSFGAITRTIRGQKDDPNGSAGTATAPGTYPYNFENSYYPANASTKGGAELANSSNWDNPNQLALDVYPYLVGWAAVGLLNDVQADEFSFNFMGYSGTFYYSGTALGWQVKSDQNIKVTFNGFLNAQDVVNSIQKFKQFDSSVPAPYITIQPTFQPNVFSGFTLTVPDGTKYTFGGPNGIEYTSDYKSSTASFTAVTWLLTEVVDANNNKVDFTYQRTYPTVNFSFSQINEDVKGYANSGLLIGGGCGTSTYTNGTVCTRTPFGTVIGYGQGVTGTLQWPMYLSTIKSPNETITFNISDATCLRDPDLGLIYSGGGNTSSNSFNWNQYPYNPLRYSTDNLKWEQLDKIVISNSASNIYRQYQFAYSASLTQRLTLNNFIELDNASNVIDQYQFSYNNVASLPIVYDGNYTDHWGYYNNSNVQGITLDNIFNYKSTNPSLVTTGLLNQITYPTGGYTKFNWEPHDYSQVVSTGRQSLTSSPGYAAGGSRIKEITSFEKTGTLLSDKKYFYKREYTAGGNTSSLLSSGILNGMPTYTFNITNRDNFRGDAKFTIKMASLNSLTNYSYNGVGSYIGYDEVTEVNADGSYTRNFFTSYGPDLNGISHYDIAPTGYIGWKLGDDAYFPMSTLEGERGKPIGIYQYTKNDMPVQKTNFTYRNDAARLNNHTKLIDYYTSYAVCDGGGYGIDFVSARKEFTYDYYPTSKSVTNYDQNGNITVAASESYNSYNANNMLTQKTMTNSHGESVVTNYTYTSEATDATSQAMATTAHILTPIIQLSTTKNGNPVSQTNILYTSTVPPCPSSAFTYYLPQTVQISKAGNPLETRQTFYQYDIHGNIQEEAKTGDIHTVYLWGYNSQYMVAQITNSTYTAVQAAMAANGITQSQLDNPQTTDFAMRTLLNTLRTSLPNSQVSTYTYQPVVGMTSMTDPRGVTTNYTYDTFNRLYLARNDDQNIIGQYRYGYQGGYLAPVATVTPGATSYLPGTTGTAALGSVSGGTGSYTYSWYLKTSTGTVLASNLNTTSTSFSFFCSQPGTLTIQCLITDNTTGLSTTASTTFISGVVPVYGNFYTVSGYTYPYTSLYKMVSTVIFRLVFLPTSSPMNVGTDYYIAEVSAGFRPSGIWTFSLTTGGRTWNITVNPGGSVYCKIVSGTSLPVGTTAVDTGTLSYNL